MPLAALFFKPERTLCNILNSQYEIFKLYTERCRIMHHYSPYMYLQTAKQTPTTQLNLHTVAFLAN